jgi:hypothetical protein
MLWGQESNGILAKVSVKYEHAADLPTVQTSSKIMFRRGLKTVKTGTQMCEI